MKHTPGKRNRPFKNDSRHHWTRARIAKAAAAAAKAGEVIKASNLWQMIGREERIPAISQPKKRQARRARWAAGDRKAFA